MHMADGPVGVMAQGVDHLDRHDRAFEGRHAVKGHGDDHHADDRIGPHLVPGARKRHEAVDHAAPARHPQHDRKDHAEGLRPVRQGRVMQVMRAGPDIKEDQGPEVDDRQAVRIDRAFGLLGHEIIHHAQKARGQEEAHRVVAVPPLRQRILHARKGRIGLVAEQAHRQRQIVDHVQHGNRHDEGQIEPVRHIDMWLLADKQRTEEDHEIGDPDDGQPQIDIPFGFGIFAPFGDAEQIAVAAMTMNSW